jgi:hypothetical protein
LNITLRVFSEAFDDAFGFVGLASSSSSPIDPSTIIGWQQASELHSDAKAQLVLFESIELTT